MPASVEENPRGRSDGGDFQNVVPKSKSFSRLVSRKDGTHGVQFPRIFSKIGRKQWEADSDLPKNDGRSGNHGFGLLLLAFQAVGVVYGDIGTSPLYVYASIFPDAAPSKEDVIGALSLILYTITISLIFKYAWVVLQADDNGNGGTFALYSILRRQGEQGIKGPALPSDRLLYYRSASGNNVEKQDWRQKFIANKVVQTTIRCLVVIGVGAIMGDGVLTPAISVVSACEGMQVVIPSFSRTAIVGMSVGIIAALFVAQQYGTNRISFFFSPIITLWLIANAAIGVYNVIKYDPSVFKALAPNYWFSYFLRNGATGWKSLGGVLLCITGTEALFADLGHFNRRSVLVSCLGLLYPCIILTYFGQAAYLTRFPENIGLVYWRSLPYGFLWPMFVLATFAAVIASQALISAVFQIVYQAIAQGFFPRFAVHHTSEHIQGQVYIPFVNWTLMALTIIVVIVFRESAKLGQAYGLAVIVDMMLTSHFMTLVITMVWRKTLLYAIPFYVSLLIFEGSYLSASVGKIPSGGWFSVLMAGIYASIMFWWYWGMARKKLYLVTHFMPNLEDFFMLLRTKPNEPQTTCLALKDGEVPITRTPGVGLYYSDTIYGTPPVMVELLPYFPALHEVVIVITNRFVPVPAVIAEERFLVEQVGIAGFYHCIARYGYMEQVKQDAPFVTAVLEHVEALLYRAFENTLSRGEDNGHSNSEAVPTGEHAAGKEQLFRQLEELKVLRPKRSAFLPEATSIPSIDHSRHLHVGNGLLFHDTTPHHVAVDVDPEHDPEGNSERHSNTWPLEALPPRAPLIAEAPTGLGSFRMDLQIGGGGSARESLPASVSIQSEPLAVLTTQDLSAHPVEPALKLWADKMVEVLTHVNEVPANYRKLAAIGGEIRAVGNAQENGKVVYVMASAKPKSAKKKKLWKRLFLEVPFMFLVHNFHVDASKVFGIPEDKLCEVGLRYHL